MFPDAANDVKEVMGIRVWPNLSLGAAHRRGRNHIEYLAVGAFGSASQASNVRERAIYDKIGIAIVFLSTSGTPSADEFLVFRPGTAQAIWKF